MSASRPDVLGFSDISHFFLFRVKQVPNVWDPLRYCSLHLAFDIEWIFFTICMHVCTYIVFLSLVCSVCSILNN